MDEVSAIIGYAERPRAGGWSLRSALVRYAQPEPARAAALLELVRRTDGALKPHTRLLERAPHLLAAAAASSEERKGSGAVQDPGDLDDDERRAVALLVAARELDHLGDVLAGWAADRTDERPDRIVDDIARRVFAMLDDLHVARERRPPRRS